MGFFFQDAYLDSLIGSGVCFSVLLVVLYLYWRTGKRHHCIGCRNNRFELRPSDACPQLSVCCPSRQGGPGRPETIYHENASFVLPEELLLQMHQQLINEIPNGRKSYYRMLMFPERAVGCCLAAELLPGICDDVTLSHILTKLPWVAQQSLIAVSPVWQYAIESNTVLDARVLSGVTETFVVFVHDDSQGSCAMSLYSMKEKVYHPLPPIVQDGHLEDLTRVSQFLSLDGKLFLFGAYCVCAPVNELCSRRDCGRQGYVLNLAAHSGQWKRFDIGNLALCPWKGSVCFGDRLNEDKNIFVYERMDMSSSEASSQKIVGRNRDFVKLTRWEAAIFLDTIREKKLITVQDKLYYIDMRGTTQQIEALTNPDHLNSRRHLHSISCTHIVPTDAVTVTLTFVIPVNGELLTLARWEREECFEYCLLQSKGFGTDTKEIMWQKEACPSHFDLGTCFPMCLIEL